MNPFYPQPIFVHTVHILATGEFIYSREEYEKIADRFNWVDRKAIIERILYLRQLTEGSKKSVIAIYENGHVIREFVNVDREFTPLSYC